MLFVEEPRERRRRLRAGRGGITRISTLAHISELISVSSFSAFLGAGLVWLLLVAPRPGMLTSFAPSQQDETRDVVPRTGLEPAPANKRTRPSTLRVYQFHHLGEAAVR